MNIDWEEIRKEEFPALKNIIYLKAAGGSPMSKSAYKASVKYLDEMHRLGDTLWEKYMEDVNALRKLVGEYINAKPYEIAFLINTSSGMNVIASLLDKGKIIYAEGEFPSSILIFKVKGFECKKIKSNDDHTYPIETINTSIENDTNYLIHSHIQYLTGFKQDIQALGKISREHGLINIINATQSFGAFPIDVQADNVDMLVASGLKWICSGYGAGILFIRDKYISEKGLPFSSWLSVENAFSMDNDNLNVINQTRYLDGLGGTPNFAALVALKGSMELVKRIGNGNIPNGVNLIQKRIESLTNHFSEQIKELDFKIITPLDLKYRSGIITLENNKAESIFNKLLAKNVQVSLRNYPKSTEKTLLRFAFNYYNNFEDIDKTISILKQIEKS
jgi:selenocysteine lyase/cysteine desulfurase